MKILLGLFLIFLAYILCLFIYYFLIPLIKLVYVIHKSGDNGVYVILSTDTNGNSIKYTLKHNGKETLVVAVLPKDYKKGREYGWDIVEITEKMLSRMHELFKENDDIEAYELTFSVND